MTYEERERASSGLVAARIETVDRTGRARLDFRPRGFDRRTACLSRVRDPRPRQGAWRNQVLGLATKAYAWLVSCPMAMKVVGRDYKVGGTLGHTLAKNPSLRQAPLCG
jgi:hypothetical protein